MKTDVVTIGEGLSAWLSHTDCCRPDLGSACRVGERTGDRSPSVELQQRHVLNASSPAGTASPAIGTDVADQVLDRL